MNIELTKLMLPLKEKFKISHSEFDHLDHLLITLEHEGLKAFGEIAPVAFFKEPYDLAFSQAQTVLGKYRAEIAGIRDLGAVQKFIAQLKAEHYFNCVICGFEMVCLDYLGKINRWMIWELLGLERPVRRKTPLTLPIQDSPSLPGINSVEGDLIKLKLGGKSDLDYLELVKAHPGREFILDANQGWTLEELRSYREYLTRENVLFIEEPVKITDLSVLMDIRKQIQPAPLFLDESIQNLNQAMEYLDYIDGVNIKVAKFGGLIQSCAAANGFKRKNRKLMLGCFLESSLSISYAFSISSRFDFVDLDGATFIKEDPFTGARVANGEIIPDEHGYGIGVKYE